MEVSFPTAECLEEEPQQVRHIQLLRREESLHSSLILGTECKSSPGAGPVSLDSAHLIVLLLKMLCSVFFVFFFSF